MTCAGMGGLTPGSCAEVVIEPVAQAMGEPKGKELPDTASVSLTASKTATSSLSAAGTSPPAAASSRTVDSSGLSGLSGTGVLTVTTSRTTSLPPHQLATATGSLATSSFAASAPGTSKSAPASSRTSASAGPTSSAGLDSSLCSAAAGSAAARSLPHQLGTLELSREPASKPASDPTWERATKITAVSAAEPVAKRTTKPAAEPTAPDTVSASIVTTAKSSSAEPAVAAIAELANEAARTRGSSRISTALLLVYGAEPAVELAVEHDEKVRRKTRSPRKPPSPLAKELPEPSPRLREWPAL
mmetsp:Transcript_26949/g.68238  ORF Transcript_26949/g.68238 Transcript_26949/m.68238 type:complete len:302 (-) Transcript_26949:315-1220(-)